MASLIIERTDFDCLLQILAQRGYRIIGPTVRDGAIVYDRITSVDELPAGWTEEQERGRYRLKQRNDGALFGYAVGPHSWKKFLFPSTLRLWRAERREDGLFIESDAAAVPRFAFIGARACDLQAIPVQDRVFMNGAQVDADYKNRREHIFVVALNCSDAGGTCFCVSMQTGPKATHGFDLALTEVLDDSRHYFVVEIGSTEGAAVMKDVPHREADAAQEEKAEAVVANTASRMGRSMETGGIKELLYNNLEHPRWDDVASRCLACANCTMVCPTCFCSNVEDVTDLTGDHAERWRKWDSCFTLEHSYLHGGPVRSSFKARYRQWMTHKLATWIDQFGTSGCVGCGRCITWCPVGIDITEEVRAIRGGPAADEGNNGGNA